uniref:Heparan sulfate 2-O-sulfotransferase pipe n=1 Tax=Stomoxys calcitrans TaxID=35570 RepID=A0A1I8PRZ0_STOCA
MSAYDALDSLNARDLNNTVHAGLECIFFNRLEKVGSQSLSTLLIQLSEINDFTPYVNEEYVPNPMILSYDIEKAVAEEIAAVDGAMSYVEHINWVNFTKFDLPKPIYVNLVRHPIQKVMSAYYYIRHPAVFGYYVKFRGRPMETKEWFDMSFNDCVKKGESPDCIFDNHIMYNKDWRRFSLHLCGNHPDCANFNSPTATQIAKQNIEREYAVVGSWEDTNITLTVLEHYIPRFFRGATDLYNSDKSGKFKKNATPHNTNLEPEVEAKLKAQFSHEIELYNFCKQRLYKQYIAIKKDELMVKYN